MEKHILIPAENFCTSHEIALTFIEDLNNFGLVTVVTKENTLFIPETEVQKLERILVFNQELDINLPGIETIFHLLERLEKLQHHLSELENQLKRFQ
jgi:MerR family transcriptional regulator/heat shock protein HspR